MGKLEVLMLGGTGAMGNSIVKLLAYDEKYNVTITSRSEHISMADNITYIKGNAKDREFLKTVLSLKIWDIIVDFMVYTTAEFKERSAELLQNTNQYIFISSARVYAASDKPITEDSPRLLDVCKDKDYLSTDEYALTKARQEDIILKSNNKNYTIVRPSLTYDEKRLQFAIYEKEGWLYRVMNGKKVIFPVDLQNIYQTLSYGRDVAQSICLLFGNQKALGETVHIAAAKPVTWGQALEIYSDSVSKYYKKPMKICYAKNTIQLASYLGCEIQLKYSRGVSKIFDNSKLESIIGKTDFIDFDKGADMCLKAFFEDADNIELFKQWKSNLSWRKEAYLDKISGDFARIQSFKKVKHLIGYCFKRFI